MARDASGHQKTTTSSPELSAGMVASFGHPTGAGSCVDQLCSRRLLRPGVEWGRLEHRELVGVPRKTLQRHFGELSHPLPVSNLTREPDMDRRSIRPVVCFQDDFGPRI